ncbi:MAG TPA: restriction endonuclease, partial [Gemmata sp.]|nr:restriction endonuclease [Gemmata sp.]
MSDWLDYQKLVASIYRDMEGNAIVTHDDKIRGRHTGIERQIDVSIRTNIAGHSLLIIVQAKHRNRPADVNIVGEFKSVIEDVGAAKGVLICSKGFTSPALEYGRTVGIDLCTAHDAQSRKWAIELKIPL